jgi:hypothetical protein
VRIEERRKGAQDAAFGLAAQAEQNEVVARKNGVHDLRHDGVVVADDAGEDAGVVVLTQAGDEVFAEFVFHAAGAKTFLGKSTAAQFAQRAWKTHEGTPNCFSGLYAEGKTVVGRWSSVVGQEQRGERRLSSVAVPRQRTPIS